MRSIFAFAILILCIGVSVMSGQQTGAPLSQDDAVLELDGSARVIVTSPLPLAEAIRLVSEEYGWLVDYEGPVLTDSGIVESHGRKQLSVRSFQSDFQKPEQDASSVERTLQKIIVDYNHGANPDKYSIRKETTNRYLVVGESAKDSAGMDHYRTPILDTRITVPTETRTAEEMVDAICNALSMTTGMRVVQAGFANAALLKTQVALGGDSVPARTLLLRTVEAVGIPQVWFAGYDPEQNQYVINVSAAARNITLNGKKVRVPLNDPRGLTKRNLFTY